jgi:hypothetical protein
MGRAIPLLPLWAVRPVQSLSACTGVHFLLGCKWINLKFQIGCLHEGTVYEITFSYMVWVVLEVKISVFLG